MEKLENSLIIFTDGSSLGNPGPGGWGALLMYKKLDEVVELGGTKLHTTNNEMELTAIISALSYAINNEADIHIYTDSQYAISGITTWIDKWIQNNWKTADKEPVKNKEIWELLHTLVNERPKNSIHWHHVRGHVGIPGNERVDDIARELAEGTNVKLYRGNISDYPYPEVLSLPTQTQIKKAANKSKKKKSGSAYSYLSLVDGKLERHATWAECEMRVTGRSSKFKKALSKEHEQEILKEWGISE